MEETQRKKNRETVRAWRYQNRQRLDEEREDENYKKSLRGRLETQWAANWQAATPDEQQAVEAARVRAAVNWCAITECIDNITNGRLEQPPFIDLTYRQLQEFFAEVPASISFWPDADFASRLDPDDFELLDDDNFKRYGRFSKIPLALYHNFLAVALQFVRTHPDQCEESVRMELEATVKTNAPPVTPATQRGFRQSTRAEESATQRNREHVEQTRRLIEARREVSDV